MNLKSIFYIIPTIALVNTAFSAKYEIDAREIAGKEYSIRVIDSRNTKLSQDIKITPGTFNRGSLFDGVSGAVNVWVHKKGLGTLQYTHLSKVAIVNDLLKLKMYMAANEKGQMTIYIK